MVRRTGYPVLHPAFVCSLRRWLPDQPLHRPYPGELLTMLRQATYTRTHGKTRRQYRWQRVNANGVTVEQIQWLKGRAQPQVCGLLTTQGGSIHACRANALGIIDCAEFPPANRRTAWPLSTKALPAAPPNSHCSRGPYDLCTGQVHRF